MACFSNFQTNLEALRKFQMDQAQILLITPVLVSTSSSNVNKNPILIPQVEDLLIGPKTRIKVVKFNINWCIKHKTFDTKNLYFSNTYLLKVSTKDTGTGANTHSIHPYCRVRAYMLSNSTIKRLKQAQRRCSCFSVKKRSLRKQKYFLFWPFPA